MANFRFKIIYNREQREFDHLYELGKARFARYLNFLLSDPFLDLHFLFFQRHRNIFVFLESVRKMYNYIPASLTLDPLPPTPRENGIRPIEQLDFWFSLIGFLSDETFRF